MVLEEKLPFGPPPILPELKDQLKEYLLQPERLPIHDPELCQEFWPRKPNIGNLFHHENSPVATALKVKRDPFTGEILEFYEVGIDEVGLTNKNSTSLSRAPGPSSESTRGSTTNYPFWPGGFADPILNLPTEDSVDLTKDLLTIPPGFTRGLEFREDGCTLINQTETQNLIEQPFEELSVVNLLSVVEKDQDLLGLWTDSDEVQKTNINVVPTIPISVEDSDVIPVEFEETVIKISDSKPKVQYLSDWAEIIDVNKPCLDFEKKVPNLAHKYPFELDTFQKQAILKLEEHSNVFVAAHTSAGKTVVAEYAIALSQKHMTRTVYTSPIKALSNQKYGDFKQIFNDVGLITGDFQINETASCLIMTTEILRSMLFCGSDVTRDLEYVIFDEVHYINDTDRGYVWEEVLILLPSHVTIVMLSATAPNTLEFADWVGCTKQRKVYVITTTKRPVPLVHYLYTGFGGKSKDDRFLILDGNGNFNENGYKLATRQVAPAENKSHSNAFVKNFNKPFLNEKQEQTMWVGLIDHLKRNKKLPVVAFTLSRNRCDTNAHALRSLDLNTKEEKSRVYSFFERCIKRLKEPDQKLPQVLCMKSWLENGIGVHHSGILPILKEIVEKLFQKGLVKILFATETFAMGVNMPTKTVLFDSIRKFDGKQSRNLLPAEYIQMAGRAGRRGLDDEGTVIIICKNKVIPSMTDLKLMMLGKPEKLSSQFRLTYVTLLNLLRTESLEVENMLSHSFREVNHHTKVPKIRARLEEVKKQLELLPQELPEHLINLTKYFDAAREFLDVRKEVWPSLVTKSAVKELVRGRIIVLTHKDHLNKLGLILDTDNKKSTYTVLVLTHTKATKDKINTETSLKSRSSEINSIEELSSDEFNKMVSLSSDEIFQPDGIGGHDILQITPLDIFEITNKNIKIDADLVLRDWNKRQIERFRYDPVGKTCNDAIQELTKLTQNNKTIPELSLIDFRFDLKIKDINDVTDLNRWVAAKEGVQFLTKYTRIANFEKQFHDVFIKKNLENLRDLYEFNMSNQSMSLYPEYKSRVRVLEAMEYIDSQHRVKLKGRVACGIHTNELILTELVLSNILTNLKAEEVAALLSCLVFQAKTQVEPVLNTTLENGKKEIEKIQEQIQNIEREHNIFVGNVECLGQELNFGLVQVVYEWALQKPFAEIMTLTDVQEGIIVRCIQQLNDTLGDVKDAAMIIGDPNLKQKMEEASNCIKRDIVFAVSLYTQEDNISI